MPGNGLVPWFQAPVVLGQRRPIADFLSVEVQLPLGHMTVTTAILQPCPEERVMCFYSLQRVI